MAAEELHKPANHQHPRNIQRITKIRDHREVARQVPQSLGQIRELGWQISGTLRFQADTQVANIKNVKYGSFK
jgi:hypothetical protein